MQSETLATEEYTGTSKIEVVWQQEAGYRGNSVRRKEKTTVPYRRATSAEPAAFQIHSSVGISQSNEQRHRS